VARALPGGHSRGAAVEKKSIPRDSAGAPEFLWRGLPRMGAIWCHSVRARAEQGRSFPTNGYQYLPVVTVGGKTADPEAAESSVAES